MSHEFNIDEIFEIATHLELNAVKFYSEAALAAQSPAPRELLQHLAETARSYIGIIAAMREEMAEAARRQSVYESRDTSAQYLWAWTADAVFSEQADPFNILARNAGLEEILNVAIRRKKESIVFYHGLRNGVKSLGHRDKVDHFIKEEMDHLARLTEQLLKLTD